jgi:hypothetical protein
MKPFVEPDYEVQISLPQLQTPPARSPHSRFPQGKILITCFRACGAGYSSLSTGSLTLDFVQSNRKVESLRSMTPNAFVITMPRFSSAEAQKWISSLNFLHDPESAPRFPQLSSLTKADSLGTERLTIIMHRSMRAL